MTRLRDDHLLQAQALSLAIEREVEKACGVALDTEDWMLNLDEGRLERAVEVGGGAAN